MSWSVGIIGCGHAAAYHAPAVSSQPDFRLAGCAGRRPESVRAFAERHGTTPYGSPDELIEDESIDVVFVTTPEWVRLELLEPALRLGRHLFVEKPLYAANGAARVSEDDYLAALRVLDGWDRDRTTFGVNFNYRTMPHMRRMKSDLDGGELGEIKVARAWSHFACWSHVIDLLQWMLGPVASLAALQDDRHTDRVCTLQFAGGPIGTLCGTSGIFERSALLRIELHGTGGRATAEGVNGTYRREDETGADTVGWTNPDVVGDVYASSYQDSIAAYCSALSAGEPAPVSADDGLAELAVEAAIARSAREEAPTRVGSAPVPRCR